MSGPLDLVLFDHWKTLYRPSFEMLRGKFAPGTILVADNMLRGDGSGGTEDYARAVRAPPGMSSVLLPVGSGIEISRYMPD